jgi:hypothetical protein
LRRLIAMGKPIRPRPVKAMIVTILALANSGWVAAVLPDEEHGNAHASAC